MQYVLETGTDIRKKHLGMDDTASATNVLLHHEKKLTELKFYIPLNTKQDILCMLI